MTNYKARISFYKDGHYQGSIEFEDNDPRKVLEWVKQRSDYGETLITKTGPVSYDLSLSALEEEVAYLKDVIREPSVAVVVEPYRPPSGGKCIYNEPWVGPCSADTIGETDYCLKHVDYFCECGNKATKGCTMASSLVCGRPICDDHENCKNHSMRIVGW